MKATFGKEWWVSDNWGLGLAGQVVLGSIKDSKILSGVGADAPVSNASWTVAAFNVLFSASFN
ncbi:MAG TPA: hypothetical protein VH374_24865 [Polyangia bacterium]|nr:hypothetical protein [Polyangia bacterium]